MINYQRQAVLWIMLFWASTMSFAYTIEEPPYRMRLDSIIETSNMVSNSDGNNIVNMNTKFTFKYDAHGRPTENSMYVCEEGKFRLIEKINFEQYEDKGNLRRKGSDGTE